MKHDLESSLSERRGFLKMLGWGALGLLFAGFTRPRHPGEPPLDEATAPGSDKTRRVREADFYTKHNLAG